MCYAYPGTGKRLLDKLIKAQIEHWNVEEICKNHRENHLITAQKTLQMQFVTITWPWHVFCFSRAGEHFYVYVLKTNKNK